MKHLLPKSSKVHSFVAIEKQSAGKQLLRVEEPTLKDNRNVGWYEASDHDIHALKHME